MTNKERREALGMGKNEYLLYSLILDIGSRFMTGEELEKLVVCFMDIKKGREA